MSGNVQMHRPPKLQRLAINCFSDHIRAAVVGPPKLENVDPFFGQHNMIKSSGGGGASGVAAAIPWHDCAPPPDIDLDDDIVEEIENEITGCHFAGFQVWSLT